MGEYFSGSIVLMFRRLRSGMERSAGLGIVCLLFLEVVSLGLFGSDSAC